MVFFAGDGLAAVAVSAEGVVKVVAVEADPVAVGFPLGGSTPAGALPAQLHRKCTNIIIADPFNFIHSITLITPPPPPNCNAATALASPMSISACLQGCSLPTDKLSHPKCKGYPIF